MRTTDIAARITIHCLSRCGIHLTRLLYAYQLKKDEKRKGEKTAKTKPNPNTYKWTDDKRQRTKRGGFEGEEEEEEREATLPFPKQSINAPGELSSRPNAAGYVCVSFSAGARLNWARKIFTLTENILHDKG